jgi:hypothetical protein
MNFSVLPSKHTTSFRALISLHLPIVLKQICTEEVFNISLSRTRSEKTDSEYRNIKPSEECPARTVALFFMSPSALYLPESTHSVPIKTINTGPTVYPERNPRYSNPNVPHSVSSFPKADTERKTRKP